MYYKHKKDVTALQAVPGIVGALMNGFAADCNGFQGCLYQGIWYGGDGTLLGVQVLGIVITIAWTVFWTAVIMLIMAYTPWVGINITPEQEELGLDVCQVGEQAYDETLGVLEDLGEEAAIGRLCEFAATGDLKEFKALLAQGLSFNFILLFLNSNNIK